ncbi:hypothetical protein BN7_5175 [Wickerhamomyces ciferrii]|uniref:Uncharacterized protein n=1 Tax=Wickerhamomyces ciferrii (strain ATCC 14091 / BCRC 22168 / CBS 111 / JCM 3599 / NBRC 0793 / NRRL Y-1031 F-60-10) TaxID=1206466 RepID=K0KU99_WICCF|nr:uncharacterized protein BN7_5175 [Wickerhamomyces ciferrii]CCH45592.1 hypothetical protein BN7_5175 [Wickerhamomyces ciferrii]
MSNQIDNLSLSFNEILLNVGTLFDELVSDKTTNLVLPNNNKKSNKLNDSIKQFDKNLDDILIQLNDISLFDRKLKQTKLEKEQAKLNNNNTTDTQEKQIEPIPQQQSQSQPQEQQQQPTDLNNNFNNNENDENILDDINMFLSTVPDGNDQNLNGEFNDNIQDLLMENDPYGGGSIGDVQGNDGENSNLNFQDFNNDNNGNDNMGNNGMEFENNIFDEIDSMLNI